MVTPAQQKALWESLARVNGIRTPKSGKALTYVQIDHTFEPVAGKRNGKHVPAKLPPFKAAATPQRIEAPNCTSIVEIANKLQRGKYRLAFLGMGLLAGLGAVVVIEWDPVVVRAPVPKRDWAFPAVTAVAAFGLAAALYNTK